MTEPAAHWTTDQNLFSSLPGGQAVIEWFGFCPSFHDATLERVELARGSASLAIRAFRMTAEMDAAGHYVLDRHALITLRMRGVTGLKLDGDTTSIIGELTIRRLSETPDRSVWRTCNGPVKGDIEVAFDTSIGLFGSIHAKELEFVLQPLSNTGFS